MGVKIDTVQKIISAREQYHETVTSVTFYGGKNVLGSHTPPKA
jgi:hypothetical protein